MKKRVALLMAMTIVFAANVSVFANDYRWGGHHEPRYNHYRQPPPVYRGGHRGGHHNDGLGIAVGVVGGLLLGSALMSTAQPPPPPPVVYVNPPPQTIYQQQPVDYQSQQPANYQSSQTGTSRTVIETLGYNPQKYYTCMAKEYDANDKLIGSYKFTMSEPCEQYRPAH